MFMNGCWGCLCEAKTKKTKSPVWMSYRIRYTFMKMSRKIKCWKMEAHYACEESCIFSLAAWLHKAFMKCYSLCTLLINIYMLWNHPQSHPHPAPQPETPLIAFGIAMKLMKLPCLHSSLHVYLPVCQENRCTRLSLQHALLRWILLSIGTLRIL